MLYCVLQWGLGHATRSAVLIQQLINQHNEVVVGSDGESLNYLKEKFPNLKFIELPAYGVKYYESLPMWLSIFIQIPKILIAIFKEHQMVVDYSKKNKLDFIISDNRFGCFSSHCKSIFLTHQIKIQTPFQFLSSCVFLINKKLIENFDRCWIPDKDNALSGVLSNGELRIPKIEIGILSDLEIKYHDNHNQIDLLIINSGPEPMRSKFEKMVLNSISKSKKNIVFVGGKIDEKPSHSSLHFLPFVDRKELALLMNRARAIACRSGYSTLMDLEKISYSGKRFLIPTPGQTEQQYLAELQKINYGASVFTEREFVDFLSTQ